LILGLQIWADSEMDDDNVFCPRSNVTREADVVCAEILPWNMYVSASRDWYPKHNDPSFSTW
jgi:hypothetical protein